MSSPSFFSFHLLSLKLSLRLKFSYFALLSSSFPLLVLPSTSLFLLFFFSSQSLFFFFVFFSSLLLAFFLSTFLHKWKQLSSFQAKYFASLDKLLEMIWHTVNRCSHRITIKPSFTRFGSHRTVRPLGQVCPVPLLATIVQQTSFCAPEQVPNIASVDKSRVVPRQNLGSLVTATNWFISS